MKKSLWSYIFFGIFTFGSIETVLTAWMAAVFFDPHPKARELMPRRMTNERRTVRIIEQVER
jgi:hypothetical protein